MRNRLVAIFFVLSVPCFPRVSAADVESPKTDQEIKLHFERGVQLYNDEDYKLAVVEFRRAYDLGHDYRVLYNIGQVNFQLGNYAEAKRTLQKFLDDGGARVSAEQRAQVIKDIEALKIRTAQLHVVASVGGADLLVDGERVAQIPPTGEHSVQVLVNGGAHRVALTKPGYLDEVQEVTLAGAEEKKLVITLRPKPVEARSSAPLWIAWGATALLAGGTAVAFVGWRGADKDLDDTLLRQTTQQEINDKTSASNNLQILTIGLGSAAVIAAGISLYLTLSRGGDSTTKETSALRQYILPNGFGVNF
jgi:tetratricopeptide (TPR) repeat protein